MRVRFPLCLYTMKKKKDNRKKKKCIGCGEPCTRYRCWKCYCTKGTSPSKKRNMRRYHRRKKNARTNT